MVLVLLARVPNHVEFGQRVVCDHIGNRFAVGAGVVRLAVCRHVFNRYMGHLKVVLVYNYIQLSPL